MKQLNVLMVGTGEYTTGYVHGAAAKSDKSAGVVALTMFDLRRQGKVGRLLMAGTNGRKFPGIRKHFDQIILQTYRGLDVAFESYPADDVQHDPLAYRLALDQLSAGDIVIIFTPDDTHFSIAMDAVEHRCQVLIAKPIVKTLDEHLQLAQSARRRNVLVAMEVHKRWDPIYIDARDQIGQLGEFSYFYSYMSQPKSQLDTFRHWAGKSSDISYYLNAHHIDFNWWAVGPLARPRYVTALASAGVAKQLAIDTEDTISLAVQWENVTSGNLATAVYTASWIAPQSDVHSQQRLFYMGHGGEVQVDQAHRGYSLASDQRGLRSPNPMFMKYTPDAEGQFAGQNGYGYLSLESFVQTARSIAAGQSTPDDVHDKLATVDNTVAVTAVLEAGRRSLDNANQMVEILYDSDGRPAKLKLKTFSDQ